MKIIGISLFYSGAWAVIANGTPTDMMPYLDKIGTVGLALLVAYMMYKELDKRETTHKQAMKEEREEQMKERQAWAEKEKYYLNQLLDRLDEHRLQVNDLIRTLTKKQNEKNTTDSNV